MQQPRFFLKPPIGSSEILYRSKNSLSTHSISFRSLDLSTDLETLHSWVTQPYTAKFWQLNVDRQQLENIYRSILDNPLAHSFVGLLDDKFVCQIDCYHVSAEEIGQHVSAGPGDCGLHILMLPPRESGKGWTEMMLRAFTEFFFSHPQANTLYGEPDVSNQWGNIAANRAGFQLVKTITLSYKTANLYSITKDQFHATNPEL